MCIERERDRLGGIGRHLHDFDCGLETRLSRVQRINPGVCRTDREMPGAVSDAVSDHLSVFVAQLDIHLYQWPAEGIRDGPVNRLRARYAWRREADGQRERDRNDTCEGLRGLQGIPRLGGSVAG